MGLPKYEDRTTIGGFTVREGGRVISRGGVPRPAPGPQYPDGETRAGLLPENPVLAGPGHGPLVITHSHEHSDYAGGQHDHVHSHSGPDADHNHAHVVPPGAGISITAANAGLGMGPNVRPAVAEEEPMPRSITGIDPGELIERFLTAQGVRVDHALQDLEHAKAREARDARERLDCAGRIYLRLRQAKQAAANEQNGWLSRASGFSWDRVLEARERVALLEAHYDEACLHDDEIKAEVARRSSW